MTTLNDPDAFVIHRLRAKPVEYTIRFRHFVKDGARAFGITVSDIAQDRENRLRIAADLRVAAAMLEDDED